MKKSDLKEQLQLEGHNENDPEATVYKNIWSALHRDPEFALPPQFADRVVDKIVLSSRKASSRDMFYLVLGVTVITVIALVGAVMSDFKPDFGVFKFLSSNAGLLVFGILFIGIIQWLDNTLLKRKFSA